MWQLVDSWCPKGIRSVWGRSVKCLGLSAGVSVGRLTPSPYCLFCHSSAVSLPFASVWKRKGNGCCASHLTKLGLQKSVIFERVCRMLIIISIYTLSDLGVFSNLISSLSLADEHYSPPTEWIMRKPNKNKMAGVNSRFASVSNRFLMVSFWKKMLLRSLSVYILKQLFFSISMNSGRIFTSPLRGSVNILPLYTSISKNNC